MNIMKTMNLVSGLLIGLIGASVLSAQEPAPFSWAQPQARVLPTGDLEWAPHPFEFVAGETVRYIDYEGGDDANPGSKSAPWKHHPWDENATGKAAGAGGSITYVFKGGVIYRGSLKTNESGQQGNPIRLTRDPSWGEGEAWIVGSQAIEGGWKRASAADVPEGMPEPDKVWMREIADMEEPWCLWLRDDDEIKRIHLAREPDWEISDPDFVMSEWYSFDGPARVKGEAPIGSRKNYDDQLKEISMNPDFFGDHTRVWTMWSGGPFSAMGTPYEGTIEKYDPETGTITRSTIGGAFYFGLAGKDDTYFLERHPAFLDQPGEFYFQPTGKVGGTLFIRLPGDMDPNQAIIEVGDERHTKLIDLVDVHHIDISGLRFSFLNVSDSYNFPAYPLTMRLPTAIQLVGDCRYVTIRNNRFIHCAKAVQAITRQPTDIPALKEHFGYGALDDFEMIDHLLVADNEIVEADHGGISVESVTSRNAYEPQPNWPTLGRVDILRNRLHRINFRPRPPAPNLAIPSISIFGATTGETAGNVVTRSWGSGIYMQGGKDLGARQTVPLIRYMVHHNKIIDALLVTNDWGALQANTGGPIYLYNNHVGNPVGPHPHKRNSEKADFGYRQYAHNGYGIYLDGSSHKKYVFNNIAWGKANNPNDWFRNRAPQMMVNAGMCNWFNNSFDNFLHGAWGSSGSRSSSLGNIYAEIGWTYIGLGMSNDISTAYGGEDPQETLRMGLPTIAYANNIFQGVPETSTDAFKTGVRGPGGIGVETGSVTEFSQFLEANGALSSQGGWQISSVPYINPSERDFRPNASVLQGKTGAKFFVPFSLASTVAEWSFHCNNNDPEQVYGENFNMTAAYFERNQYYDVPWNNLEVPGATVADFDQGILENYAPSALVFDGSERYGIYSNEKMSADFDLSFGLYRNDKGQLRTVDLNPKARRLKRNPKLKDLIEKAQKTFPGEERETVDMDTNNFLVEMVLRVDGTQTASLVSKTGNNSGYEIGLADGRPAIMLMSEGRRSALIAEVPLVDGWHHLIAEVDRNAGQARIYIDGKLATEGSLAIDTSASLANTGDFFVGKGAAGMFKGAMDFLRVSRGTLEDSKTTIEELHAWQFTDGPFLKDFLSQPRDWSSTFPGAIAR